MSDGATLLSRCSELDFKLRIRSYRENTCIASTCEVRFREVNKRNNREEKDEEEAGAVISQSYV